MFLCIALLISGALLTAAPRLLPGFADRYAEVMNPLILNTLGRLTGLLPFSLAELLILAVIPVLVFSFRKRVFRKTLACILCAMFFLFQLNEGVYFSRTRFAEAAGMQTGDYSNEELEEVCRFLAEEINTWAPRVTRGSDGLMRTGPGVGKRIRASVQALGNSWPYLSGYCPQPKPLCFSFIMSRMKFTGVYSMFTVEANYNREIIQYNIPFTMAHELSHLKGIVSEKEANFIGYLSCIDSEDPDIRYSGAVMGWVYCGNELHDRDRKVWREIYESICEEAHRDMRANNAFWDRNEGAVAEAADQANDAFLKAGGVSEGVKSYDLVVDLITEYEINRRH